MRLCHGEKGFTLIELLTAMSILLILFAASVPLYITVSQTILTNRNKLIATNLANRELERVKNIPYDQVGTVGGNPSGVLEAERDEAHSSGTTFHFSTRVWWVDDPYDGTAAQGTDPSPNDYKQIQISVSKQGDSKILARVSSKLTREGEEPPPTGGNILVRVFLSDGKTPVEDARIDVTTGPSSPITAYTGSDGTVLLAELNPSQTSGDYSLSATKAGYVVPPDDLIITTTVITGQTRIVEFLMDVPGHLIVHLRDPNGQIINKHSKLTLSNPDMGDVTYDSSDGNFDLPQLYPGNYDLTGNAASYKPNPQPVPATVTSNQTTEIDITLQPTPMGHLHLDVFDASNGQRIGPASVTMTNNATGSSVSAQTNSNGILEIDLEVATYTVEVTMADYLPYTNSSVVIEDRGNTNLTVNLQPAPRYGSILVRAQYRDGRPRAGVLIRVVGSGYDVNQATGSDGQTIFTNLNPGSYTVYRWGGYGWRYPRYVTVVAGQQVIVVYSY